MKEKIIYNNKSELFNRFKRELTPIYHLAQQSDSFSEFKVQLQQLIEDIKQGLPPDHIVEREHCNAIFRLIEFDSKEIKELSTGTTIQLHTMEWLWLFLRKELWENIHVDLLIDLYKELKLLEPHDQPIINPKEVKQWMHRWPSGLDKFILESRQINKDRIINLLIQRIDRHRSPSTKYHFPKSCTDGDKWSLVQQWWNTSSFHLAMAIKNPTSLNIYLGYTLSKETMQILNEAYQKGIPFFITPYFASLICTDESYDDATIRSYVLYSSELVQQYGNIKAWEKEDALEPGKPNAAGWLVPTGGNIHRRYPEVAILIPDSMGRACGGLCASCQRMYDFQSARFNFNLDFLLPKEGWPQKLERLMQYFEEDSQLRDILITGGDALMSQNGTIRNILENVLKMAQRKRRANLSRADGEKYAELQRIRLGSRLLAYLPMRINEELVDILKQCRIKGESIGIKQFIIQTHFQTPLEVTPDAQKAIQAIQSAGWIITNQLVFNVAASRRGHTAKLRHVLNQLGVLCYYTFTVKGFEENYAVYTPNSRSMQEQEEEKSLGILNKDDLMEFNLLFKHVESLNKELKTFIQQKNIPFIATDRNVMNLPGIGKSMTFHTVGILPNGKRVLEFEHDKSRRHSPIVNQMSHIYIAENKSIAAYLRQLQELGEDAKDYDSIWSYNNGTTSSRFALYQYPDYDFRPTPLITHLGVEPQVL